jgi:beta-galactosidase
LVHLHIQMIVLPRQTRDKHRKSRKRHVFVQGWGELLASTSGSSPEIVPHNASDNTTLRWAVRTKGDSGFLFVNNYERITTLSDKTQVSLS